MMYMLFKLIVFNIDAIVIVINSLIVERCNFSNNIETKLRALRKKEMVCSQF